ncbi:MAG: YicC/YloC family endoribonuclease [Myxococcota bacterium]
MLRSMTGFGTGSASAAGEELAVELKSVNHKFCEVKARLPRELAALEPMVVKTVKERLTRGAVEVFVRRQTTTPAGTVPVVDLTLAREYRRAYSELAQAVGLPDEVSVRDIASQPGVLRLDELTVDVERAGQALATALEQALRALAQMRQKEGEAVRVDLESRLARVASVMQQIKTLAPRVVEEYRTRLADRAAELARGVPVDPQRLAQEVAFFAERTDVAEELTRLESHLAQFHGLIASGEPSGRKMDFLVQEMHREVNTTGSKSQHPEISSRVVEMKAELERIREQVQNVE